MLYPLLRQALFCIDAERAHDLSLPFLNRSSGALALLQQLRPLSVSGLTLKTLSGWLQVLIKMAIFSVAWRALVLDFARLAPLLPNPRKATPSRVCSACPPTGL